LPIDFILFILNLSTHCGHMRKTIRRFRLRTEYPQFTFVIWQLSMMLIAVMMVK